MPVQYTLKGAISESMTTGGWHPTSVREPSTSRDPRPSCTRISTQGKILRLKLEEARLPCISEDFVLYI